MSDNHSRQIDVSIVYVRCLAISCIVLHHSIAVFQGWPPNNSLIVQLPTWISFVSQITKDIGLALFTFIAGRLAFVSINNRNKVGFLLRKVDRLLLPCAFWALLYWVLFPEMMVGESPVNGTHLWFLPMIFVCFAYGLLLPGVNFLWLIAGGGYVFILVGAHYLWRTPISAEFGSGGILRPLTAFATYFPIFAFGAAISRKGRSQNWYLGVIVSVAMSVAQYFVSHSIIGLLGTIYSAIAILCFSNAALCTLPRKMIFSLDRCSFGIYLIHQFFLNAAIMILSNYPLGWRIELPILFLMAFPVSGFVVFTWQRLVISQT